jgi:adenylate kinase family enzyme
MQLHPEANGFLIDGCPRTLEQATLFAEQIAALSFQRPKKLL